MTYEEFLNNKERRRPLYGFEPLWLPDFLFGFQHYLDDWAIRTGRCAIYADCGLGKTPMQLVWAENVLRKTNKPVLIVAPLAVSIQTVREGAKFGIDVHRSQDGRLRKGINITNYERIGNFDSGKVTGIILDESSILKNFDGKTRRLVTRFMKDIPYRLLCTATPAPNDFMELGTSSEALGDMSRNSMLGMFFTNDGETTQQWRLKGHANKRFWQWVSTWARAVRKPSDLGFDDEKFILPPLDVKKHAIPSVEREGFFAKLAKTLTEQRIEAKKTVRQRCERVAEILPTDEPCLVWCNLNPEGDLLEKIIPGAVQVAGKDRDEVKEERLNAFSAGQIRVLVTKSKIAGFGLNWQHCSTMVYFPTHSHERYYQAVRRCWRFGQEKEVTCHLVYTEAEEAVLNNMLRKERQAVDLYDGVVREMGQVIRSHRAHEASVEVEVPRWL